MYWTEVNKDLVEVGPRRKITYNGRVLRFQIPESLCVSGLSEYGQLTLDVDPEFAAWFDELVPKQEPWRSVLNGTQMTLKIDDSTQIFDENRKLELGPRALGKFQGCMMKCIVEIVSVYYFKDMYGLTCKVYQMTGSDGCLFKQTG